MASVNSRFAEVTQRDILRMQDNAIPNNTKKGIKVCKGKQCFDTQLSSQPFSILIASLMPLSFHNNCPPTAPFQRLIQVSSTSIAQNVCLAPVYLLNQFSFSRDYHSYNTRHKDLIRMPLAKTSKFQSSFKYNGAREWNSLPSFLRQESSLSLFKRI